MKLSEDNQQKLTTGAIMTLEFYKIMMATFLILFVPQKCEDKVCTISENFNNNDTLHFSALISNFVTFIFVLYFYRMEFKRENWCIQYLDIDPALPNNNLDKEIETYPEYKEEMKILNINYLQSLYLASSTILANFGFSSVVIAYNYEGVNSITATVSFLLLIGEKLYSSYTVGIYSVKDERAFSAYMKISRTFNTIDTDFKKIPDTEKGDKQFVSIAHTDVTDVAQDIGNIAIELVESK